MRYNIAASLREIGSNHALNKQDYLLGEECCKKIIEFFPDDFFALSNLAFFSYKLNKQKDCESAVGRLAEIYPDSAHTLVDVAYIRLLENKQQSVLRLYRKLIRKKDFIEDDRFNIVQVLSFLNGEFIGTRNISLLFAMGYLNHHLGDSQMGKIDLQKFLNKTKKSFSKYKYFIEEAEKILHRTPVAAITKKDV